MSVTLEFVCDVCGEEFLVPEVVSRTHTRMVFCPCCGGRFLTQIEEPFPTVDSR